MRIWSALKAFWKALREPTEELSKQSVPKIVDERGDSSTSHLRFLALLQRSGRLLDFLQEDITAFDDETVGAAVREVHRECQNCLREIIAPRPLLAEEEGSYITVPKDYDSVRIKVTGQVKGEPPYQGVVVHRGWQASKRSLPHQSVEHGDVLAPAEVEVS